MNDKRVVILSPLLIIGVNFGVAYLSGYIIGKWAFIPMILTGWILWLFFIQRFGGIESVRSWLRKSKGQLWWGIFAVFIGLLPLPIFLIHSDTLSEWTIWMPWIILALINPWIEEFYWRGLLLDFTKSWSGWTSIVYSGSLFSINHIAFGVNSELNSGLEVVVSTLIMGIVWGIVYKKTKSLRWVIFAHFLVDFFGLSAAAFMDLWAKGAW